MAILILGKINFKSTTVWRDKEGHYVFIKEQIHQRNITLTTYMPSNNRAQNIWNKWTEGRNRQFYDNS